VIKEKHQFEVRGFVMCTGSLQSTPEVTEISGNNATANVTSGINVSNTTWETEGTETKDDPSEVKHINFSDVFPRVNLPDIEGRPISKKAIVKAVATLPIYGQIVIGLNSPDIGIESVLKLAIDAIKDEITCNGQKQFNLYILFPKGTEVWIVRQK
jgi:hypothetical protein